MGFSSDETDTFVEEILQISELSNFRYLPLKKFSSGMKVKLGFAVAMMARPDIVLLDEVLSVGDMRFRKKYFYGRAIPRRKNHPVRVTWNGTNQRSL